ncbi:polysaccharide deacetylase family protein [Streptomyces sp. SPB162]|uniref:polysaccharide deacetylase family protein n=1 Tax=Streptomyces sp. SPB162 TaxID=2940560 RepID=UPI002405D73A|nr:polysaccharide deacetylase family protein [Streptomyces sp. SPB162]
MPQTPCSLPRRRFLAVSAAALLGLGAAAPAAARARQVPVPESVLDAGPQAMALTFDDGPSPQYTPQVLDVLRDHGVRATFFVCGDNVGRYPDVVRRIAAEGHVLGNHTWSHPHLGELSAADVRDQIQRTQDAVTEIGGRTPVLFRAPYGEFADASLAVCGDLGLRPISWSVDPTDWANPGSDTIADRVLAGATTGAIVLNHDGTEGGDDDPAPGSGGDRSQTVAALKSYLPRLIEAGYTFTTPDAHPPRRNPSRMFRRSDRLGSA